MPFETDLFAKPKKTRVPRRLSSYPGTKSGIATPLEAEGLRVVSKWSFSIQQLRPLPLPTLVGNTVEVKATGGIIFKRGVS